MSFKWYIFFFNCPLIVSSKPQIDRQVFDSWLGLIENVLTIFHETIWLIYKISNDRQVGAKNCI